MTGINFERGLTRIWIVVVAAIEIAVCLFAIPIAIRMIAAWRDENPFSRFDADYVPITVRLIPILALPVIVPVAGFAIWLISRWVWRGFAN
jgi:hypothetical protein